MEFAREKASGAVLNTKTDEYIRHKEMRKKAEKFNKMSADIEDMKNEIYQLYQRIDQLENRR